MKTLSKIYNLIIFAILYFPIIMVIVFSFNSARYTPMEWKEFSFEWYGLLFQNEEILESLSVTLRVALISTVAATILGTTAAIGIHAMNGKLKTVMLTVNNFPMVNPEIVSGVAFMLLFVALSATIPIFKPGFFTLCLAHI
ncbi:MAG: hypothetical protein IKV35_05350, partial [Clostridia bacterium]|nr:hypothetical protein [Clostridia bacterium]